MFKKNQYFLIVILVLVSITFGGWLANSANVAEPDIYLLLKKNIQLFTKIYQEIALRYVDEIDPESLMKAGIEGMTQKLDPYTSFVEKEENTSLQNLTQGKYGGVGMTISKRGDYPSVVEPPFEGTPAGKAGIREGDQIIEVAGISTKNENLNIVADRLRGKKGTSVTVKINRAGEDKPLEFRLIRDIIVIQDIQYSDIIEGDIGYIRLTRFSKNSTSQLSRSIKDLKQRGMKSLILDLRSNPGGLLSAAVSTSDLFIPKGEMIVYTHGRSANREFHASQDPVLENLQLSILVNGASASASEIVAGAVQDLDRGLIIGSRTFGKGLVQTLIPFTNSTGLRITTEKYYVPSGRLIQDVSRLNRDENVLLSEDLELSSDSTKNENGKVYHTKSGRVVYGGGGIKPDIEVELPPLSRFETALIRQSMYFNFAVSYASKFDKNNEQIEITEKTLEEFRNYLKEKEFKYQVEGEEEIKKLQKIAEKNEFGSSFSRNIDELMNSIEQLKGKEFDNHKDVISKSLKREIAAKLLGSKGLVESGFEEDEVLQTALEVMKNPKEYAMKLGK